MGNLKTFIKKSKTTSKAAKTTDSQKKGSPGSQERQSLSTLFAEGRYAEVLAQAQEMTVHYPRDGFSWKVVGVVLNQMGRIADALAPMQKAVALSPKDAEAHSNLGSLQQSLGQLDEAVASCRRALRLQPDFAAAHRHLGDALRDLGQLDEAIKSYRRALAINPDFPEALNNLGVACVDIGQLDEAIRCYQRALAFWPDFVETHCNLAVALHGLGQINDATRSYRRALAINPDHAQSRSNLLFTLSHTATVDAPTLFAEHRRFATQHEMPLRHCWPEHTNTRMPNRCLRVGFVSADLYHHSVANFIEPILAHLSVSPNVSLHAYSNLIAEDHVSQKLRGYVAHWHKIARLSDETLAQRIREDGIDILFDLSGHTAGHRLLTFARKPAPIQISWIGYPGTTGLDAMDYYLTDRYFLPPGQFDDQFTEKLMYLPGSPPFLSSEEAPPVNPLPALTNGYLTFGSFNRLNKLSPAIIALWSQLLRALPDAHMILGGLPQAGDFEMLASRFKQEGIARERLSFHNRGSMPEYLSLHHQIDICLDTFPYNGGTTTCHALWMGVPVLTITGTTVPGRTGAWALQHVGLESCIANNPSDFVEKGLYWGSHIAELAKIRLELRDRMKQSALCHPELIARALEHALRIMWQRWCAGLPAESFEVGPHDKEDEDQRLNP